MSSDKIYKLGIKNIFYSVFAQGIVFVTSIVIGFVLPKFLGVEQFGYWQVYLFYSGYVMFFSLGFNDGLYLRYGGLDYNQLPFKMLRSTMRIFIGVLFVFTVIFFMVSFLEKDYSKVCAFGATSINILLVGINGTLLTILQFTNRIKLNSFLTILNKIIFVFLIVPLFFINWVDFRLVIAADLFTKFILLGLNIHKSLGLFAGKTERLKDGFAEYLQNIIVGNKLMIANILSSLIIGIGRFIVERFMSIETYSLYSFATTITLFFLVFITASSLSLYPLLSRIDSEKLPNLYTNINKVLTTILFLALAGYFPLFYLIKLYLPEYMDVFNYLNILFVIVFAQGKMIFLVNTYYKVLREEKAMLIANITGFVVAVIIVIPTFYFTRSILGIVIGTTIALLWRCYASEIYLKKKMGIGNYINMIVENIIIIIFIISFWNGISVLGILIYMTTVLSYTFFNKKIIYQYINKIFKLF